MNSESVDLIATDPPFNKNKDFHATPDSLAGGAKFQDRWSWERDVQQDWVDQITDDHPRLMEAIESARYAHTDGMGAFMCFMAVRLLEMRRILRPTGSIYLHCDPTASHYLKAVMDAIFGWKQFRNEITWQRSESHNTANRYGNVADIILFYSKTPKFIWNQQYQPYGEQQLSRFRQAEAGGRRYKLDDLTAPRPDSGSGKFEWRGTMPGASRGWGYTLDQLEEWWAEGRIQTKRDGTPRMDGLKTYLDEAPGKPAVNIWTDIPRIANTASERTGYPTQKPLALCERMILASSNPGDMVLDPFCGCATTCVAAERQGRQWAGIDIWDNARAVVLDRMARERLVVEDEDRGDLFAEKLHFTGEVPVRTDDGETAAPFLRVAERRKRPPLEGWQKLSRAEIVQELIDAQSVTDGLVLCAGCGRELEAPFMELDHIVPRSDRGENDISNRILLCRPCNGRKSARLTMKGLLAENRKAGWMQDPKRAERARDLAHERYEDIRYNRRWPATQAAPDLFDRN
ncbi:MAG: DNA methyltransferase [Boseongicola sp.]|nr:DNA methyltransferase [Boseongicola sp.]